MKKLLLGLFALGTIIVSCEKDEIDALSKSNDQLRQATEVSASAIASLQALVDAQAAIIADGLSSLETANSALWEAISNGDASLDETIAALQAQIDALTAIDFSYDADNGIVSITMADGSVFVTGDIRGAAGADGADGSDGANGADGADGSSSGSGSTGATGAQGEPGIAGLQGPVGAQGAQGAQGNTGATGSNGLNGSNGSNGASAYDLWITAGNSGTVEEFLASLVGNDGAQGPQGETGATGPAAGTVVASSTLTVTGTFSESVEGDKNNDGDTLDSGVTSESFVITTHDGVEVSRVSNNDKSYNVTDDQTAANGADYITYNADWDEVAGSRVAGSISGSIFHFAGTDYATLDLAKAAADATGFSSDVTIVQIDSYSDDTFVEAQTSTYNQVDELDNPVKEVDNSLLTRDAVSSNADQSTDILVTLLLQSLTNGPDVWNVTGTYGGGESNCCTYLQRCSF